MWFWDSCRQTTAKKKSTSCWWFAGPSYCWRVGSSTDQWVTPGDHWVCLSTIVCRPGRIKVYDRLFQRVGQIAILHSCHMLMQVGNSTPFINGKFQKEINTSDCDCSLVALAFATGLCHGLDPVTEAYDQQNMHPHYLRCLNGGEIFPFPKASEHVPYHFTKNITTVAIFCVCRIPNDKKECFQCNGWWFIQPMWELLTRWSTKTGDGSDTRQNPLH